VEPVLHPVKNDDKTITIRIETFIIFTFSIFLKMEFRFFNKIFCKYK